MDSRRQTILAFLKTRGPASLGEIAAHLEVSKQGALRHLEALESAGLATVAFGAMRLMLRRLSPAQPLELAGEWTADE